MRIVSHFSEVYSRVWDVADYVVPPAENGAFFVATNVIVTPNQTRGKVSSSNRMYTTPFFMQEFVLKITPTSEESIAIQTVLIKKTIAQQQPKSLRWRVPASWYLSPVFRRLVSPSATCRAKTANVERKTRFVTEERSYLRPTGHKQGSAFLAIGKLIL